MTTLTLILPPNIYNQSVTTYVIIVLNVHVRCMFGTGHAKLSIAVLINMSDSLLSSYKIRVVRTG